MRHPKGFTLLEILLAVALLGILASIVIFALNPTKQLGDTRNAQRRTDVNTILNAVYQYAVDTNGSVPATITNGAACGVSTQEVCKTGGTCTGLTDLVVLTTNAKYVVAIPTDPTGASTNGAGYEVFKNASTNRVTVCAPDAEQSATISVTR